MVTRLFPGHRWQMWKFAAVPKGWWSKLENRQEFFQHILTELHANSLDGLYSLTQNQILNYGGTDWLTEGDSRL